MERVTVNLTDRTHSSLREAVQLSESNKTNVINKSIHLYLFMLKIEALGGDIYIREKPGADLERVRIF